MAGAKAFITGFANTSSNILDKIFQMKLAEWQRKKQIAEELGMTGAKGVMAGEMEYAPETQVGSTYNPLSLVPGMPQTASNAGMTGFPIMQQEKTPTYLGSDYVAKPGYYKPKQTEDKSSFAFQQKLEKMRTDEAIRRENAVRGIKEPLQEKKDKRQMLVDSTKIREEFINRPEVKEYVNINTQVRSMDSLLKKAKEGGQKNKVSLDQALISMYNKLTDPNSVVRESEYARTPENLPLLNRFSGAIKKIGEGGAGLTDADREALVWGAKIIADERGRTFNETLQSYEELADQYGIDKQLITRNIKPHSEYSLGTKQSPAAKVQQDLLKGQGKSIKIGRFNVEVQ